MQQYYKLQDGALQSMPKPKNISNPTAEILATYAAEKGYKELKRTEPPTPYHSMSYREYGDYIGCVWHKPSLESLKATLKEEAIAARDAALHTPTVLNVEGVGAIEYTPQSAANVTALVAKLPYRAEGHEDGFILADDSVIMLSKAQLIALSDVLEAHVNSLYAIKSAAFAAIEAAETIEELLTINQQ